MKKSDQERVMGATLLLQRLSGQGVLVGGGIVLTAAHCVQWSASGDLTLGSLRSEPAATPTKAMLRLVPLFIEPISDLAALAVDTHMSDADAEAYYAWEESTEPLEIRVAPIGDAPLRVHILTHDRRWVTGAFHHGGDSANPAGRLCADAPIKGGTSGGPVADDAGQLVGLVSNFNEVRQGPTDGRMATAALALPMWLHTRIKTSA